MLNTSRFGRKLFWQTTVDDCFSSKNFTTALQMQLQHLFWKDMIIAIQTLCFRSGPRANADPEQQQDREPGRRKKWHKQVLKLNIFSPIVKSLWPMLNTQKVTFFKNQKIQNQKTNKHKKRKTNNKHNCSSGHHLGDRSLVAYFFKDILMFPVAQTDPIWNIMSI
jgi:hypothetical protein